MSFQQPGVFGRRAFERVRLLKITPNPIEVRFACWLWRSREDKRALASAHEVFDDIAADQPRAPYDQALRLPVPGFELRVHLASSSDRSADALYGYNAKALQLRSA